MQQWVAEQIAELEGLMESKGLSIKAACRVAKIPHSTFFRWKAGVEPRVSTVLAFRAALEDHVHGGH